MKISMPLLRMACDSSPCLQVEHSLSAPSRCTRPCCASSAPRAPLSRALHPDYDHSCRAGATRQQEAALALLLSEACLGSWKGESP